MFVERNFEIKHDPMTGNHEGKIKNFHLKKKKDLVMVQYLTYFLLF